MRNLTLQVMQMSIWKIRLFEVFLILITFFSSITIFSIDVLNKKVDISEKGERSHNDWAENVLPTYGRVEREATGLTGRPICPTDALRWRLKHSQNANEELTKQLELWGVSSARLDQPHRVSHHSRCFTNKNTRESTAPVIEFAHNWQIIDCNVT